MPSTPELTREGWSALTRGQRLTDVANGHEYVVQSTETLHGHTLVVATDSSGEEFDLIFRRGFHLVVGPFGAAA